MYVNFRLQLYALRLLGVVVAESGAESKGQLYLFREKVGHAKTPGAYNDRPKNRTQTVRRNTENITPQNEQLGSYAISLYCFFFLPLHFAVHFAVLTDVVSLNSPQSQPKHKTGATNQTQLNETEKGGSVAASRLATTTATRTGRGTIFGGIRDSMLKMLGFKLHPSLTTWP